MNLGRRVSWRSSRSSSGCSSSRCSRTSSSCSARIRPPKELLHQKCSTLRGELDSSTHRVFRVFRVAVLEGLEPPEKVRIMVDSEESIHEDSAGAQNKKLHRGGGPYRGVEWNVGEHTREEGCKNSQEPRGNFVRRHEIFPI